MNCLVSACLISVVFAAFPAQKAVLVLLPTTKQDGEVQPKTPLKIKGAYVYSVSNDNEQFHVAIEIEPSDSRRGDVQPKLFVNDREIGRPWGIVAPDGKKISSVYCSVEKTDAEAIANALGVPCATRKQPDYKLKVKFTPEKKTFALNEKIELFEDKIGVAFGITNVGEKPFEVTLGTERGRPTHFTFTVIHAGKKQKYIGSDYYLGGLVITKTLAPGKSISNSYDLSDWYAFDKPGRYTVDAKCRVTVRRPRKEVGWPKNCEWAHEAWDYEFNDKFTIVVAE